MHQKFLLNGIGGEGVDLRSRDCECVFTTVVVQTMSIDVYDELEPFKIAICGYIDRFSRNIMWLRVYKTNNDPRIIAGYGLLGKAKWPYG